MILNRTQYRALHSRKASEFALYGSQWGSDSAEEFHQLGIVLNTHKCVRILSDELKHNINHLIYVQGHSDILDPLVNSEGARTSLESFRQAFNAMMEP